MDSPKQEHPSARFVAESIDGINVRSAVPDRPFYKVVQDKDGQTYAQGVRLQTDKVERANRRLQSMEVKEMDIQTDSPGDGQGAEVLEPDEHVLAQFLRDVAPIMEQDVTTVGADSLCRTEEAFQVPAALRMPSGEDLSVGQRGVYTNPPFGVGSKGRPVFESYVPGPSGMMWPRHAR
ncbi:hypothetical protein AK812_SmicGene17703 [Symbiodinium microadriaticum]|uniref:Uncharacterized protein n=1 Tax=Symbiodinium microadriaticum TaxID=2951 RepID=A0A1Q9DX28_SYMMI|nr:hypothetical protein AK812_SmicGene17703 [Symbiodinium microadriaticum]